MTLEESVFMGKILVIDKPRHITYETYEEKKLENNEVRIQTLFSGISAGTQLTLYKGVNPFINKTFNSSLRILENAPEGYSIYPAKGCWGYEEVGIVIEIGEAVSSVKTGDIVYGVWSHASTTIKPEEYVKDRILPKELDPIAGIYSQMGSVALNAILDSDIHIGETVAVFGQGVPGQIVMQLAKASGAKVIVVDVNDWRLSFSKKLGANYTINPIKCDAAKTIKEITNGRGADVSIEISGSDLALHEAVRATCYNGRVVCSGFIQGGAGRLMLGEEFHHNRIQIVSSQIENVSPSLSNRWNRIRMEKTIMDLAVSGKINLKDLITHIVPFEEAASAYEMLDKGTENCMQVVLKF